MSTNMQIAMDTVLITDQYPLSTWGYVQTIDSTEQERYATASVADYLSRSSGVYVKSYGGSSLSTVGLRGLSAQHTQVAWNGVPLNSPMLGLLDVSLLAIGSNNKVQLCYGNSAVETNGASGGAILLSDRPLFKKALQTNLNTQIGSFGNYQTSAKITAASTNWAGNIHFVGRWAANDYLYQNLLLPNKPLTRQQPENAKQYHLNAEIYRQIGTLHTLSVRYWGNYTSRNLQPPIIGSNFNEQQTDQAQRIMMQWNGWTNAKQQHRLEVLAAWLNDKLFYKNDTINIESYNQTHTYFAQANSQHRLSNKWQLNGQLSYKQATILTNNYGQKKAPSQQQLTGFAKGIYQPTRQLSAEILLKLLQVDKRPILCLPALAIAYSLFKKKQTQWQLNASTALNANLPSLNDLYWYPGGNPALLHENSFTQELGSAFYRQLPKNGNYSAHFTMYYTRINNLIVWLPTNGTLWQAQNRKSVAANGLEWQMAFNKKYKAYSLQTRLSYTLSRSINLRATSSIDNSVGKQLLYVPLHTLYFNTQMYYKNYGLLCENTFVSQRYTTTDNSYALSPYLLTNLYCTSQYDWKQIVIKVHLSINNVFNVTYYPVNYRPAPLRSIAVGCSILHTKK